MPRLAFWTPGIQMFVHKTWLEFLSKEGLMRKERNCLLAPAAAPLRDENVMRWRGADGGRRPLIFHWEGARVLRRLYWNEGMHLTYQHLFLLTNLPILERRDLANKGNSICIFREFVLLFTILISHLGTFCICPYPPDVHLCSPWIG